MLKGCPLQTLHKLVPIQNRLVSGWRMSLHKCHVPLHLIHGQIICGADSHKSKKAHPLLTRHLGRGVVEPLVLHVNTRHVKGIQLSLHVRQPVLESQKTRLGRFYGHDYPRSCYVRRARVVLAVRPKLFPNDTVLVPRNGHVE